MPAKYICVLGGVKTTILDTVFLNLGSILQILQEYLLVSLAPQIRKIEVTLV